MITIAAREDATHRMCIDTYIQESTRTCNTFDRVAADADVQV